MVDAIDGLPAAVNGQQPAVDQRPALALRQIGPDDDVDDAVLVFEGDEDHAAGRAGTLAGDDQQAQPLLDYYDNKGVLFNVNGEEALDVVFQTIQNIIEK